jgi:hypothetical protein
MDLNENEVNQGVPIEKLLQVIGLRDVELVVQEDNFKKLQEQALTVVKQNAALTSELAAIKGKAVEPIPVSPELEQLRKANTAGDERVLQLERQCHDVALERDAAKAEVKGIAERLADLQFRFDELQTKVALPPVITPVTPQVNKGKKR